MEDTGTARAEALQAQAAYRMRVRAASIAIVFGLAAGTDPEDALRQADDELYRAKAALATADTG
ncbi:MAG: hypothetical protein M3O64_01550 [Chloroflexota bacterium]|nr:hypothetical protein [Chloroflexota bacterium]